MKQVVQWFVNGDVCGEDPSVEGTVVRYYRSPKMDGDHVCVHCGYIMHDHGWIDGADKVVCPSNIIVMQDDMEPILNISARCEVPTEKMVRNAQVVSAEAFENILGAENLAIASHNCQSFSNPKKGYEYVMPVRPCDLPIIEQPPEPIQLLEVVLSNSVAEHAGERIAEDFIPPNLFNAIKKSNLSKVTVISDFDTYHQDEHTYRMMHFINEIPEEILVGVLRNHTEILILARHQLDMPLYIFFPNSSYRAEPKLDKWYSDHKKCVDIVRPLYIKLIKKFYALKKDNRIHVRMLPTGLVVEYPDKTMRLEKEFSPYNLVRMHICAQAANKEVEVVDCETLDLKYALVAFDIDNTTSELLFSLNNHIRSMHSEMEAQGILSAFYSSEVDRHMIRTVTLTTVYQDGTTSKLHISLEAFAGLFYAGKLFPQFVLDGEKVSVGIGETESMFELAKVAQHIDWTKGDYETDRSLV